MLTAIRSGSLGDAWKSLLSAVLRNGRETMDGSTKLNELCHVCIEMLPAFRLDDETYVRDYDHAMTEWMRKNFFGQDPIGNWGYSYGQRMNNYQGLDQFSAIVEKLNKNPESKSATMCLACPPEDTKHSPCAYSMDFKIRDGKLDLTAYFRSQDAGKKFCADMYCLRMIQEDVCKRVGAGLGSIYLLSSSMHIYEQDLEKAQHVANAKNDER